MSAEDDVPIESPARGSATGPDIFNVIENQFTGIHLAIIIILAISLIPVTVGIAIFQGAVEESTVFLDNTETDIWVTQENRTHLFESSYLDENVSTAVEETLGVETAHYLIFHKTTIATDNHEICGYIVGFNVSSEKGGPWDIISGQISDLEGNGTVFVDNSIKEQFTDVSIGDSILLGQTNHTIIGFCENAKYFNSPFIFMSYENAKKFVDLNENTTSFILVEVEDPKDPFYVSNEISKINDTDAFVTSEFKENTVDEMVFQSGIASAIAVISIVDFLIVISIIIFIGREITEKNIQKMGFTRKDVSIGRSILSFIIKFIIEGGSGFLIGSVCSVVILIALSNLTLLPVIISIETLVAGFFFLLSLYIFNYLLVNARIYITKNWRHLLVNILSIVVLIIIWFVLVEAARNGNQFLQEYRFHQLPTPMETWNAFVDSLTPSQEGVIYRPSILAHSRASIWRVLVGFSLAAIVGIPSGLIMGRSRYAHDVGGPIVELIRPIPPLAWIGVGLLIFTFNVGYFIVFIGVVFPLILSTINGVRGVDEGLIEAARTLGAKRFDILRKVVIPGSLPSIVTGMRIGLGIGWMSIVAAEMVGMKEGLGLGYYVWLNYDSYGNYDNMVAGMLLIGFIGWLMNYIIQMMEKRAIRWQE